MNNLNSQENYDVPDVVVPQIAGDDAWAAITVSMFEATKAPVSDSKVGKASDLPVAPRPLDKEIYNSLSGLFDRMKSDDFQEREAAGKDLTKRMYESPDAYKACVRYMKDNADSMTYEQRGYVKDAVGYGITFQIGSGGPYAADHLAALASSPAALERKLNALRVMAAVDTVARHPNHGGGLGMEARSLELWWTTSQLSTLQKELKEIKASGEAKTPPVILDAMASALLRQGNYYIGKPDEPLYQTKAYFEKLVKENPEALFGRGDKSSLKQFDGVVSEYLARGGSVETVMELRKKFEDSFVAGKQPYSDRNYRPYKQNLLAHWTPEYLYSLVPGDR